MDEMKTNTMTQAPPATEQRARPSLIQRAHGQASAAIALKRIPGR
jgi:hypothetical protein